MHQLAEKWPPLSFFGRQDSTTCLGWALEAFWDEWKRIGVDYGQRHQAELECRVRVREKWRSLSAMGRNDSEMIISSAPVLGEIADCALTDERRIAFEASGLPNTFVPGRNLLFFTLAASLAYRRGLRVLVGGMCETD